MEVERISEEYIKPCSPTPLHLKYYKISLLDQLMSPALFSAILFYPNQDPKLANDDAISKRSLLLKESLSKSLAHFYPLAGMIKDHLSIDCNDQGVRYVEARVGIPLHEYLNQPDLTSMHKMLPEVPFLRSDPFHLVDPGSYVAMIQETTFACGGITIGVHVSHMFMDGTSLSSFLKHWAATASADRETIQYPNYDASSMFPQHAALQSLLKLTFLLKTGKVDIRRFMFDESAVAALKAKGKCSQVENPTRVEVVSAILLKCIMGVFNTLSGMNKPVSITHLVNLRRRAVPPLPECSVGSLVWSPITLAKPEEMNLTSLVRLMREDLVTKVNGEYVKKIQGDGGFVKLYEEVRERSSLISEYSELVTMNSWCNFGLYDIDFGWGKPMWASSGGLPGGNGEITYMNVVHLMDARSHKGIEAWVVLTKEELDALEKDDELLAYASVNPSPLS